MSMTSVDMNDLDGLLNRYSARRAQSAQDMRDTAEAV